MSNVIRGIDRGTRTVDDVEVHLTELVWDDDGRSFEVHRADTGVDLTEDRCFDTWPTDEQIAVLVREHDGYWSCPGCGTAINSSRGDLITDHIRDCCPTGRNEEAGRDDRCSNRSSPLPGDPPVCSGCATVSDQVREGHPWCDVCGWYLVYDPEHSDWTSFAEREYRRRAAGYERRVTASAEQVRRALVALRDRVPDGWRVAACRHGDGAIHALGVEPPTETIDATAYLTPPDDGDGWRVRVHNRGQRIDFPLYHAGGACAASFASPGDALDAAVNALRVEIAETTTRR